MGIVTSSGERSSSITAFVWDLPSENILKAWVVFDVDFSLLVCPFSCSIFYLCCLTVAIMSRKDICVSWAIPCFPRKVGSRTVFF